MHIFYELSMNLLITNRNLTTIITVECNDCCTSEDSLIFIESCGIIDKIKLKRICKLYSII